MFGFLRLFLAAMVMFGHLFWLSDFGRYAVFGFYIISGYLMTLVMHESYSYSLHGLKRFLLNRFLRLYPAYWIACLISVAIILFLGANNTQRLSSSLALPQSTLAILSNFSMIFASLLPNEVTPRLSPATWALTVELFYYGLIAIGFSKTKFRTSIWLLLSILYVALTYFLDLFWHARYFAIPAGSLPFALGAMLFFLNKEGWAPGWIKVIISKPGILFSLMIANAVAGSIVQNDYQNLALMEIIFYLNVLICFFMIYSLIRGEKILDMGSGLDKTLGDYSYPVYLLHWQLGALVSWIIFGEVTVLKGQFTPSGWVLSGVFVFGVSFLMIRYLDRPLQLIRNRVRGTPLYS